MTAPLAAVAAEGAGASAAGAGSVAAEGAGARTAAGAGRTAAKTGKTTGKAKSGPGLSVDPSSVRKTVDKVGVPASSSRRVLIAEFVLCMVFLAFSPLVEKHKDESAGAFMKRGSATMGLFFFLALLSTAGRGASRAAAAFGGLVTLVLVISQRSIFTLLTTKLGKGVGEDTDAPDGLPDTGEDIGGALADAVGDVADQITPLPPLGPLGNGIR